MIDRGCDPLIEPATNGDLAAPTQATTPEEATTTMSKNTKTTEITFNALCSGEELFQFFQSGDKKVRKLAVAEATRRAEKGSTSRFPYKVLGVTKTTYRQAGGDLEKAKALLTAAKAKPVEAPKVTVKTPKVEVAEAETETEDTIVVLDEALIASANGASDDNGGIPLTDFQKGLLQTLKEVTSPEDLDAATEAAGIPTPTNSLGQEFLASLEDDEDEADEAEDTEDDGDTGPSEDETEGLVEPSDEDLAAMVAQAEQLLAEQADED